MAQLDWYLRANLRPRHLHLLVALDDFRNIGKVAASLHVTQPAVSKSLAELEKGLGIKLFERTARGVNPTAYGECLIRHARTLLTDLTQARDELRGLMSGTAGNLRIGALSTAAHSFLPHSLALLKKRSPNTNVVVNEGTMESLLPDLWSGKLDLIVGRLPSDRSVPGLEERILAEEAVTLVAGRHHPLAARRQLRWPDLAGYPWVLPPVGALLRAPLERAFELHAMPMPMNCVETLSAHLLCSYLQLTDAIAFIGKDVSRHYESLGLISILPLELPRLMRPVGVVWNRQRSPSPSAQLMIECLEQAAQRNPTPRRRRASSAGARVATTRGITEKLSGPP
jgi:DNA-binding transcriptional LysR family regulator